MNILDIIAKKRDKNELTKEEIEKIELIHLLNTLNNQEKNNPLLPKYL